MTVGRSRWLLAILLGAGLLAGERAGGAERPADLPLVRQVSRDVVAVQRPSYNYAPAALRDGPVIHLYWCGGVAGDYILHAQAASLDGPFHAAADPTPNSFDVALAPSKSPDRFDGLHACDPNVIKLGGRFFLYYGGEASEGALTAIGVASGTDGVHFERMHGGAAIVTAARTNPDYAANHLTYGAGQPAATVVGAYVYLSFTDSTGSGVNRGNGASQFALRSKDPGFGEGVEELTAAGWVPRAPGRHTAEYSFLESFGLDWATDKGTGTILAVTDRVPGRVTLLALDPETLRTVASGDLPMAWKEGPALLADAPKSTPPREACDRLVLSAFAAEGASGDPFTWHAIARSTGEVSLKALCSARRAP